MEKLEKNKKFQKPKSCRQLSYSHSISNFSHGKLRQSTFITPTTENHKWFKLVDIKIFFEHVDYGNTGCGVFKRGIQN